MIASKMKASENYIGRIILVFGHIDLATEGGYGTGW